MSFEGNGVPSNGMEPMSKSLEERAKEMGIDLLPLKDAQKVMNTRLLSGWSMLADACPISNYPLIKNQTTGEVWSVRCQMPVTLDSSKIETRPFSNQNHSNAGTEVAEKETPKLPSQNESDLQSERLAEKLLLGWKMLGENCPVTGSCPLMQDSEGRLWSAALNDYVDSQPGEQDAPVNEDVKKHIGRDNRISHVSELKASKPLTKSPEANEGDLQSQRIGEKLLQGWTMLSEACPVTQNCPLLQDPEGRLWSAALNDYVPNPKEEDRFSNDYGPEAEAEEAEKDWKSGGVLKLDEIDDGDDAVKSTRTLLSGVTVNREKSEEFDQLRSTLLSKLAECRHTLAKFEVNEEVLADNMERMNNIVKFIATCCETLKVVEQQTQTQF
mmetsp:Transcript_11734/g.15229  ORF Transcript_11734/g.15229 Transcript_11734/m.15229 type:complete len:384 (+) Transcript_11734:271-1422(+)